MSSSNSNSSIPTEKKASGPPWWRGFVQGGVAAMSAGGATHPLDLVKVRMQIQGEAASGRSSSSSSNAATSRLSSVGMARSIVSSEGVPGLFRGVSASLLRQGVYSSTRFGVYDVLKRRALQVHTGTQPSQVPDEKLLPLPVKVGCGLAAGAVGAFAGTPADVSMVRMQADGKLPMAQRRNYRNVFHALASIVQQEGVLNLWRGSGPTVFRAMVVTASQLATYDQARQMLVGVGFDERKTTTTLAASFTAGGVASLTSNPIDVIKTRVMNMKRDPATGDYPYRGAVDCTIKTVRAEGPLALYKGLVPTFVRQGPFVVLTFLTLEYLRKLF